jgi:hypothetical protein
MDPHRAQGQSKTRVEAGGQTCPAHDPAAVRPLEPGQRPLGLVARDSLLDRASARLWGCPHARRHRGAPPTSAEAMAQVFGVIALIRGQHRAPLARSALLTHADVQGLQPRDNLGPLVAIGGRRTRGHRHASGVREAVDEDALALPARRDALTAACARGNRRHPPRHTATASCRVPRPAPGGARAWRPGSHRPASAAATDARHPWTPMGPAREVAPAAAGDQDVAHRMHHLAKGGMGHAPTPRRRLRRKKIGQEPPLQVTSPFEGAGSRALREHGGHESMENLLVG